MNRGIIHQLSSNHGFIERYLKHLINSKTQFEAYKITENEYEILFGHRKYSNFESFRQIKRRMNPRK